MRRNDGRARPGDLDTFGPAFSATPKKLSSRTARARRLSGLGTEARQPS